MPFEVEVLELRAKLAKFDKDLDKADKRIDKFEKDTAKSTKAIGKSFQALGGFIAGAFAVSSLINFQKEIIRLTGEFQRFEAVLTNTLGSSSKAQKALKEIQQFAAQTPFQVNRLTESFIKLANRGFIPTTDQLRKLGDLASSTGKDFDQLAEAILDAQTGEFERLKEFGIRAQKAGDQVTFTFKGVQTQVEFTEQAIQKYLIALGEVEGVTGAMAAISGTLEGKISNLNDNWEQFLLTLGKSESGIFSSIVDGLNSVLNAVNEFNQLDVRSFENLMTLLAKNSGIPPMFLSVEKSERELLEARMANLMTLSELDKEQDKIISRMEFMRNTSRDNTFEFRKNERALAASQERYKELREEFLAAAKAQFTTKKSTEDLTLAFNLQTLKLRAVDVAYSKDIIPRLRELRKEQQAIIDSRNLQQIGSVAGDPEDIRRSTDLIAEQQAAVDRLALSVVELNKALADESVKFEEEERVKAWNRTAETVQGVSAIYSAFYNQTAKNSKELALAQIVFSRGAAIAAGIASAATVPFPGNLTAIASIIAAVGGAINDVNSATRSAEVPQFWEGTEYVRGKSNQKGRDQVPSMLTEGERIFTVRQNRQIGGISNDRAVELIKRGMQLEKMGGLAGNMAASAAFQMDYKKLAQIEGVGSGMIAGAIRNQTTYLKSHHRKNKHYAV